MITGYRVWLLLEQGDHEQLHEVLTPTIPTQEEVRGFVRLAAAGYGFRLNELVEAQADCELVVGPGDPLN